MEEIGITLQFVRSFSNATRSECPFDLDMPAVDEKLEKDLCLVKARAEVRRTLGEVDPVGN